MSAVYNNRKCNQYDSLQIIKTSFRLNLCDLYTKDIVVQIDRYKLLLDSRRLAAEILSARKSGSMYFTR